MIHDEHSQKNGPQCDVAAQLMQTRVRSSWEEARVSHWTQGTGSNKIGA